MRRKESNKKTIKIKQKIIGVAPNTQVTHMRNKNSNIQGRLLKVI